MANKKIPKTPLDFEAHLKQLEAIVSQMENQTLSLDEALSQFEQGISLAKNCQKALQKAKQQVEKLVEQDTE